MIQQALTLLQSNKTGSFNVGDSTRLVTTKNAIVLRFFTKYNGVKENILAAKVKGLIIGNSSQLRDILSHRNVRGGENITDEQRQLAELLPMIPFSVIKEAGLSLTGYSEITKGPEETVYRKDFRQSLPLGLVEKYKTDPKIKNFKVEKEYEDYQNKKYVTCTFLQGQHFAGARLFKIDDRVFLLDVDRNELLHGIINPFLVELLDKTVTTIEAAYASLKPQQARDAEIAGKKVLRQGEWFFVPCHEFERVQLNALGEDKTPRGTLRAGPNRPNWVEFFVQQDGEVYVKGSVEHSGREHEPIELKTWHKAYPNTSVSSWSISGDVD